MARFEGGEVHRLRQKMLGPQLRRPELALGLIVRRNQALLTGLALALRPQALGQGRQRGCEPRKLALRHDHRGAGRLRAGLLLACRIARGEHVALHRDEPGALRGGITGQVHCTGRVGLQPRQWQGDDRSREAAHQWRRHAHRRVRALQGGPVMPWLTLSKPVIYAAAIAALFALAGFGFWRGMAAIDDMVARSAATATEARDSHWKMEIANANAAALQARIDQAERESALSARIAESEARAEGALKQLGERNAAMPNFDDGGLDADHGGLLQRPRR